MAKIKHCNAATLILVLASFIITPGALAYTASIERDHYGVPHISGQTDADAAFGLAYAQAEDSWPIIQDSIPYYRGNAGATFGPDAAASDYLVHWLGFWEDLDSRYYRDLTPAARRYVEGFAAGLNQYAADYPKSITEDVLPITGQDIIAAHMLRHILFYGFQAHIKEITGDVRTREMSQPGTVLREGDPIGSNAIAVGPLRSANGSTLLAINSHQPLTGPVAWYEAHMSSDEGLDIMGGTFAGSPTMGVGFTRHHGWGTTVNKPDLVDIYVLEMNPDDDNQYRLDGEWHNLEVFDIELDVVLLGFIPWSVTETGYRSEHGPVMKTEHGTYAIRYAGMNELRQVEQWLAMNKATDFESWKAAVDLNYIASFNFVYADQTGNIFFIHNAMLPKRAPGYDWQQYLPGDDSRLIWTEYHPTSLLPQIKNPASGFLHNANQTPFTVTSSGSNAEMLVPQNEAGWQTRMTNRAIRGLELFEAAGQISLDEFSAIKHDHSYSPNYRGIAFLDTVRELETSDETLQSAQTLLTQWNLSTDKNNRGAALGVCVLRAEWLSESGGTPLPDPLGTLEDCVDEVTGFANRLDPRWGDVSRHGRDGKTWEVAGGPDTLRAIYGKNLDDDGYLTATGGDGLYYIIQWAADGEQTVLGVHQYGANMVDSASPHYLDQAEDYANEVMHNPLYKASDRADRIERRYIVSDVQDAWAVEPDPSSVAPALP